MPITPTRPTIRRQWLDNDGKFILGIHKNKMVDTVARDYPLYLRRILDLVENIDPEDRDVIDASLRFLR